MGWGGGFSSCPRKRRRVKAHSYTGPELSGRIVVHSSDNWFAQARTIDPDPDKPLPFQPSSPKGTTYHGFVAVVLLGGRVLYVFGFVVVATARLRAVVMFVLRFCRFDLLT